MAAALFRILYVTFSLDPPHPYLHMYFHYQIPLEEKINLFFQAFAVASDGMGGVCECQG